MISKRLIHIVILLGGLFFCGLSSSDEITDSLSLKADPTQGKQIYPLCASCHMATGWGKEDGSFPVIAGQHRNVLIKQLADIRAKNRDNPTMYPFSDPASIGGIQAIADVTAYIATLPANPSPGQGNGLQLEQGKQLYQKNCASCHGSQGEGDNELFFPRLQGQHYAYLLRHMKWIRDGYRRNSNAQMASLIRPMKDEQLDAIADYLSRIK